MSNQLKSLKARVAQALFTAFERGTWQPRNLQELLSVIAAIKEGIWEDEETLGPVKRGPSDLMKHRDN